MLHVFLAAHRAGIVARAQSRIAARRSPNADDEELSRGIVTFLDRLFDALVRSADPANLGETFRRDATEHGGRVSRLGFPIADVVEDYGDVAQAAAELAEETHAAITTGEFRNLDRCLRLAVGLAVTEHARWRERSIAHEGTERLGELAHELRNSIGSAQISFEMLRTGTVAIAGSTSGVLGRSLTRISALVSATVAGVRLESGIFAPERVSLRDFIEEVEVGASLDLNRGGVTLSVTPAPRGVDVEVDRPLLAAALANLLSNAFKFSRPKGLVVLRTSASVERVLIEVEDQCGGLPGGKLELPLRSFQQHGADRSGLGLGLTISRKSVEANRGTMTVRDLPGAGCVFTIDLPRLTPAA